MATSSEIKKISFENISNYSKWPSRLLSLEPFEISPKSPSEVTREFGLDKWGSLLKHFSNKSSFKLDDVEEREQDLNQNIPCFDNQLGFYLIQAREAKKRQIALYESILSKYASSASCLVELGSGYGSKIFRLSEYESMHSMPLYAAEYTQSGCELTKLISKNIDKRIEVGSCDFNTLELKDIEIPEDALIFTSYSVHYVDELNKKFTQFISDLKPHAVAHFEPCFEYLNNGSIHHLMCKRYIQMNGYTRNIASCIELGSKSIGANFESRKNIFGMNPFLPLSVIEWKPQS